MANKVYNIAVLGGSLIDTGYYYIQYSADDITYTNSTVIYTARGQVSTATLAELLEGVLVQAPDTSNYFKVQSVNTTCSGSDALVTGCYDGSSTVLATCSSSAYGIISLSSGNQVTIVPYGTFFTGTGYRSATANLTLENGTIVQSFLMEQTEEYDTSFTPSTYLLNVSGTYALDIPQVACSNGTGEMGLAVTNCVPI